MWISNIEWNPIDPKHHNFLYASFEENEIKKAVISLGNAKLQAQMILPLFFTKKYWQIIKKELLDIFEDFHKNSIINKNINNTSIALIGKKDKASQP